MFSLLGSEVMSLCIKFGILFKTFINIIKLEYIPNRKGMRYSLGSLIKGALGLILLKRR
jgi:hypothetical protein